MKLALGTGKRYMLGYEHVDLANYPHINYLHDIKTLPKYSDNSVDLIYCSHSLEYFDLEEVKNVLKEWKRVLKPGGILRLAVPDFRALMELYLETGMIEYITGPIYGRWPLENGQCFYHKMGYDKLSLSRTLRDAGFINIKEWNWKEVFVGELEGFDDYSKAYFPHLQFDNGKLMSLNLECIKGDQ